MRSKNKMILFIFGQEEEEKEEEGEKSNEWLTRWDDDEQKEVRIISFFFFFGGEKSKSFRCVIIIKTCRLTSEMCFIPPHTFQSCTIYISLELMECCIQNEVIKRSALNECRSRLIDVS